ncbi:MAG: mechanosensitive ion channel family protein, partial [Parasphingopyxis sp.]|uniref:mechanosensitive ion channel family protein n=1 Tax=Parasphingopyxis sp. TaxID=1920299 RepID=UPI003FA07E2F
MDAAFLTILQDQLGDMAEETVRMLPQLAIGLVILIITWALAKGGRKIAHRIIGKTDIRPSLLTLIETVVTIFIWILGLFAAAAIILPGITPASILAGLGIGAVAIGFAFQDIFE